MHKTIMNGTVKILYSNKNADAIISAAGRISTTKGTANEIYIKSCNNDKEINNNLIEKILLSGHHSVLEHVYFNLSFDNVSVFVEQFMIEFRLASFTVKSRRYVDFGDMGFYEPEFSKITIQFANRIENIYRQHMKYLFNEYNYFLSSGIPKEDARFILPYCFKSNFYCSVNARELIHILKEMINGKGTKYPEIVLLGNMLIEQCMKEYPYIINQIKNEKECIFNAEDLKKYTKDNNSKEEIKNDITLLYFTDNPCKRICEAYALKKNLPNLDIDNTECQKTIIKEILKQNRKRELEQVTFSVRFNKISLAGVTHLVRHRMQSVLVPDFVDICDYSNYVVPESIINAGLENRYNDIFSKSSQIYHDLKELGMPLYDRVYLFLSGMTIPVITTMNANELFIFLKLRTCNRAQWEIKKYADELLYELRKICPVLFSQYGPSCFVYGKCPEGKMSCMKKTEMEKVYES